MNRSKAKGTAAESAARNWLISDGWPDCERLALAASLGLSAYELCAAVMQ